MLGPRPLFIRVTDLDPVLWSNLDLDFEKLTDPGLVSITRSKVLISDDPGIYTNKPSVWAVGEYVGG